jgi:GT2 family glycosyltransferase
VTTAVVVTYDSAALIEACLEPLEGIPTVLVDNASRDSTVALVRARFPAVRVVARRRNGGFAVAVNDALALAPDDVLIVNPDVVVVPGTIGILERYLADHAGVGIVVPRLHYSDGAIQESVRAFPSPMAQLARRSPFGRTRLGRSITERSLLTNETIEEPRPVEFAIGAAMLVRRTAIDEVGGMDRRFFLYGEDVDWCYRMWQRGWEVHIAPEAIMEHRYQRLSRRSLDLRSAPVRHHWASLAKLYAIHPSLLIGRGPSSAHRATELYRLQRAVSRPIARTDT